MANVPGTETAWGVCGWGDFANGSSFDFPANKFHRSSLIGPDFGVHIFKGSFRTDRSRLLLRSLRVRCGLILALATGMSARIAHFGSSDFDAVNGLAVRALLTSLLAAGMGAGHFVSAGHGNACDIASTMRTAACKCRSSGCSFKYCQGLSGRKLRTALLPASRHLLGQTHQHFAVIRRNSC
jgi:hypothetical protein